MNVLDDIIARGADASQIIVVCIVAAPPALRKLSEKFLGTPSRVEHEIMSFLWQHLLLYNNLCVACMHVQTLCSTEGAV